MNWCPPIDRQTRERLGEQLYEELKGIQSEKEGVSMNWTLLKEGSMPPTDVPFWATGWNFHDPDRGRWFCCARFDGKTFEQAEDPNNEPIFVPTHWAFILTPEDNIALGR